MMNNKRLQNIRCTNNAHWMEWHTHSNDEFYDSFHSIFHVSANLQLHKIMFLWILYFFFMKKRLFMSEEHLHQMIIASIVSERNVKKQIFQGINKWAINMYAFACTHFWMWTVITVHATSANIKEIVKKIIAAN